MYSLLKTRSVAHIVLVCFIRSFPLEENTLMVGHELVVVVEADEELSLELLPLDAVQAALLLTPKPAEVGFLRMEGREFMTFY